MKIYEILLIGLSVAMDAFAVSVCKGITSQKKVKTAIICGVWFAVFQMLMPTIGFFLGSTFAEYIESFDHWVVFALLLIIGLNMLKEALSKKQDEEDLKSDTSFKSMLPLALATSIDALAVGVSMALVKTNLILSISIIGAITFALCFIGGVIGQKLGEKHKKIATIFGAIVLISLGIKILIEHLFF